MELELSLCSIDVFYFSAKIVSDSGIVSAEPVGRCPLVLPTKISAMIRHAGLVF